MHRQHWKKINISDFNWNCMVFCVVVLTSYFTFCLSQKVCWYIALRLFYKRIQCNILTCHHIPVHMRGIHKTEYPFVYTAGLNSTPFCMYCATQGVYRNEESVNICKCGVVKYHSIDNIKTVTFTRLRMRNVLSKLFKDRLLLLNKLVRV